MVTSVPSQIEESLICRSGVGSGVTEYVIEFDGADIHPAPLWAITYKLSPLTIPVVSHTFDADEFSMAPFT
jgi:hypothetical protein